MINALILPPMAWAPEFRAFVPNTAPNPFRIYEEMKKYGINTTISDPLPRPWNPFSGKPLLRSLDLIRALKTIVNQRRADIIISVFEGGAASLIPMRCLGILRTPLCLWDIGLTEDWKLRERILDITVPRVDALMVLGSSQERYIRQRWKPKGQIHVIHHHVDAEFFHPQPVDADGFVLSVGDDAGRDFPTLIGAAKGLDREVIIKSSHCPPTIAAGVRNVRIMRERISYCELRDLYARASVVVVPTRETLNASGVSTILEASAMGKPLVVSDNSAIHDFVVAGETCLMVPREDPQALRDAILRLLKDPATGARLAGNARQFILERFSKPVFAENFAQTLKDILSASTMARRARNCNALARPGQQ